MRVTLIHNPKAGDGRRGDRDDLAAAVRAAGHEVAYRSSKAEGWEAMLDEPADVVAVAGGDGTVGKVARRLVGRPVPVAVLPTGTANNVARALGLADAPLRQLIAGWATGRVVPFDVGVAAGPWGSAPFIEGLGVGLFAETMARLDDGDDPDAAAGGVGAAREVLRERLAGCPARPLTVVLDGRDLSGEYLLLEAMNISHVGPNLHLAPGADPGDGLLDVVLVAAADRELLGAYLSRPRGEQADPPGLRVRTGRSLRVEWDRSDVHIDDDVWTGRGAGGPAAIDVTVRRHAIGVLLPAPGDGDRNRPADRGPG